MKVLIIGGTSYDEIIKVPHLNINYNDLMMFALDNYEMIGSTGTGKALAMNHLGHDVTLISAVGNDKLGEYIQNKLSNEGVEFIPIISDVTETHLNLMTNNQRLSIFKTLPNNFDLPNIDKYVGEADIIFLNILNYCKDYIDILKNSDKKIIVDIHDYNGKDDYHKPFIEVADIIFVSNVKLKNKDEFMKELLHEGKELVVVTDGENGSHIMTKTENIYAGIRECNLVDSNGAGDSYSAGFIHGLQYDLDTAIRFGKLLGSLTCEVKAIFNNTFTINELNNILKEEKI